MSPPASAIREPRLARAADVAAAAQLACLLEASAPKPGNVSPIAGFQDATYEDFLASAAAIGPALAAAGDRPLGTTIRAAVEATAGWAPTNTNLGLVLLLVPLARAALRSGDAALRTKLAATLAETTVGDARETYAAIRLASPAGLGESPEQDVAGTPSVTLMQAMALAAERDAIAREYATDFQATFDVGAPALRRARGAGLSWSDAIVETYLTLLAAAPDTHIARKRGPEQAVAVQRRARPRAARHGQHAQPRRDRRSHRRRDLRRAARGGMGGAWPAVRNSRSP